MHIVLSPQKHRPHALVSDTPDKARATTDLGVVHRRDVIKLRKVRMPVVAKSDPANLGMYGGVAVGVCFIPSDGMVAGVFDEPVAPKDIRAPECLWPWTGPWGGDG